MIFFVMVTQAVEIIREAAFAARIVALQRRVRKWLERRRELREKQQKELEQQLLDAALHAEEDELVSKRVLAPPLLNSCHHSGYISSSRKRVG